MEKRRHLHRLFWTWNDHPRYFITACVNERRKVLASSDVHEILREHWAKSLDLYGWAIGSYVIMPEHVHFFCTDAEGRTPLTRMVGAWKQWSAKSLCRQLGFQTPVWQAEFFDHLLRSDESYSEKWNYVWNNPVRAGLVDDPDEWEFYGHIDYE